MIRNEGIIESDQGGHKAMDKDQSGIQRFKWVVRVIYPGFINSTKKPKSIDPSDYKENCV